MIALAAIDSPIFIQIMNKHTHTHDRYVYLLNLLFVGEQFHQIIALTFERKGIFLS